MPQSKPRPLHFPIGAVPSRRSHPAALQIKMLLEEHLDELGRLITIENGKTFTEAKAEFRRAIENVEVACGFR
jgi:malonate-semialdehyde dehydrogenase (acetylating)/methylmalonate-semialdehyde dehydrogenase